MASEATSELLDAKFERLRALLELSREALLLVDLSRFDALLAKKEAVIEDIRALDERLEATGEAGISPGEAGTRAEELDRLVEAILANESTMEERILAEKAHVRGELQALERQTRVKRYLESSRPKSRKVDLTR